MKCINCGAELPNGAQFCSECDMRQPVVNQVLDEQNDLTFKQYYDQITDASEKKWVNIFSAICFLTAALCVYLTIKGVAWAVVDVIVYLAGGILIGFKKNWAVSLCVTGYALVVTLIAYSQGGQFSGVLALLCGVKATITLFRVENAYKKYKQQDS